MLVNPLDSADGGCPDDAVAVVGLACRLPQAHDVRAFWHLLTSGSRARTRSPAGRPPLGTPDEPGPARPDADGTRWCGHLDEAGCFDAGLFGVDPDEAAAMDPRQRLLLELVWEGLETARIVPESLKDAAATGVFIATGHDGAFPPARAEAGGTGPRTAAGPAAGLLAHRVSRAFGLRGPSVTVDRARMPSLAAVHLACESLRSRECALALVGGVHFEPGPGAGRPEPGGRAGAPVPGGGGGLVVLKPLRRAVADGDTVHCVIRGSAVGGDRADDGLTAPDAAREDVLRDVLRRAHARAGVAPGRVQYVELRGGGTEAAGPVESDAVGAVLRAGRDPGLPLLVGTATTAAGPLAGDCGIVALLKAVLALQHGQLPPGLGFAHPGPEPRRDVSRPRARTEPIPWDVRPGDRLAGVGSSGGAEAGCHVVLAGWPQNDAAPEVPVTGDADGAGGPEAVPWVVSGHTPEALRAQAARLAQWARRTERLDVGAVAGALVSSRTMLAHRAVVLGRGPRALLAGLGEVERGAPGAGVTSGTASVTGRTVLVFPGQGAQWAGMGRELYASSPVFAARIDACAAALAPFVDWSLTDVLSGAAGTAWLERSDVVQPVSWAVMVALAAVWESLGVRPDAVVGHSMGETAAAVVTGALSLEDAARVMALRSRTVVELGGRGGMVSVAAPAERVREWCAALEERVSVAAVNGPSSVVVSGEPAALERLVAGCEARGVRVRRIAVDYASHSAQVERITGRLERELAGVAPRAGRVPMYSTVEAAWVDGERLDAGYWIRNERRQVRFEEAVRGLLGEGFRFFVECSTHPVLTLGVEETAADMGVPGVVATGTLRRDEGGPERLLASAAELFVHGAHVDWSAVTGTPKTPVDLPTYAFRQRCRRLGGTAAGRRR
ncbi:acyltransferase domain-containing protein, partial [Streptomyces sp. PRKS01-65]